MSAFPFTPFLVAAASLWSSNGPQDASPSQEKREELEQAFEEQMRGVRMEGSFTLDGQGSPDKPAPLQKDSYTIRDLSKIDGVTWEIDAEIGHGDEPVSVRIQIDVEWAGDTPVITLTDRAIPQLGTYSARVVIHGGRYAGVWEGEGHGGHLFGAIVPLAQAMPAPEPGATPEAPPKAPDDPKAPSGGSDGNDGGNEVAAGAAASSGDWPSFRGPHASGVQNGWETPVEWDIETGENVLWMTPIPGLAHSSPVVFGDRVYVTTAVSENDAELKVGLYGDIFPVKDEGAHKMQVLCLDRADGKVLWSRTAYEGVPKVLRHPKGSHAASSPATDGKRVVAFFGSEGLYCYDTAGELLWKKDLGVLDSGYYLVPKAQWGFASSPVIHDDRVIVQCDVNGDSFVAALDAATGETVWRTARDEVAGWGTPTIDVGPERTQVICNGYKHIGAYDFKTGAELWSLSSGGGDIPVPTPVVSDGLIYIMNAHGKLAPIYAIAAGASGTVPTDTPDPRMAWMHKKGGNYMQTPIVVGGRLYCCNDGGVLACYDAKTGAEIFKERLGAGGQGFTSSGVAADGKLYFASEEGEVHVVRAGPDVEQLEVLAVNTLGETCMASAALSRGVLFYRTRHRIVALAER